MTLSSVKHNKKIKKKSGQKKSYMFEMTEGYV